MYRVRKQLGCSDRLQQSCKGAPVTVAVLDTGERVILLSDEGSETVGNKKDCFLDAKLIYSI